MVTRKAPVKKAAAEKGPAKKAATTAKPAMAARRDDFGALANAYFAKQPADNKVLLEKLRGIVESAIPDADVSIKWGVSTHQLNGRNVCALASFKDNVALKYLELLG